MVQGGGGPDLPEEPVGPDGQGQLRTQDLEGHLAPVLEVLGEVDRGHPAGPELPLDLVPIGECEGQAVAVVGHRGLR